MHIETLKVQNFRRLKDVTIELASDISIFVGANNSGKTAAAHALQLFTSGARDRFSLNDFSVDCWPAFDAWGNEKPDVALPSISMDLWFSVNDDDLHLVIDLLPCR